MFRPLLALALLALALPAQWLGPTNVWLNGCRADVFVSGGKVYVITWGLQSTALPRIELWDRPSRMVVELHMVGLAVNDPRPCARQVGHGAPWGGVSAVSRLGWNEMQYPVQEWAIGSDGWLWWANPQSYWRLRANVTNGPSTWFLTYETYTTQWTPCQPAGAPSLVAMLFEVRPL